MVRLAPGKKRRRDLLGRLGSHPHLGQGNGRGSAPRLFDGTARRSPRGPLSGVRAAFRLAVMVVGLTGATIPGDPQVLSVRDDDLAVRELDLDRKSTRLNSSHANISYA